MLLALFYSVWCFSFTFVRAALNNNNALNATRHLYVERALPLPQTMTALLAYLRLCTRLRQA